MTETNSTGSKIGLFDAIRSLIEHDYHLQVAELSRQRMSALETRDVVLFATLSTKIVAIDAKLSLMLQQREAQHAAFIEKGIVQLDISMVAKLHEYMETLSRSAASHPTNQVIAANGHIVEAAVLNTDELSTFRALISGEPNWDIASRALTEKLASGRLPNGVRSARMTLASVKYGADLQRLNTDRLQAVQDAYADGSEPVSVSKEYTRHGMAKFINECLVKGRLSARLCPEVIDTVVRIKNDPILRPFTESIGGGKKLLSYATYEKSLGQILLA